MPQLSVLIPLHDARGDAVEHLRTWTHAQTVARDRFQMVVVSDGEEPEIERAVDALLEPHDVFDVVPGADLMDLWTEAAARAAAPWLLLTENHCRGEPDCVERALEGIQASPRLDAASLEHGHVAPTAMGELGARWFDQVYGNWSRPGEWTRLNLAGFVIQREAFQSAGGLPARYGLFAAPLLAARLDERGAQVGTLPEARILHVHVDDIGEHHGHSADYARGECEARTGLDQRFAERYFGHQHLLWNRRCLRPPVARRSVGVLAKEIARAGVRRRGDLLWLSRELVSRLPASVAGPRPRLLLTRLAFAWSELASRLPLLPRKRRYRNFLRAQDLVVRLTQLRWIEANPDRDGAEPAAGALGIEQLGEGTVTGLHGLERHDGRPFRWGEPVLTVRLGPRGSERRLRIDTGGLRGSPLACVAGAYLDLKHLPRARLREEGPVLVVDLPAGDAGDLILLCRPVGGGAGSPEERRLGLALFSLELRGADSAELRDPPAVPQRAS